MGLHMFVIFGASGNAGRAAAIRLREFGFSVRGVVRDKCSAADLAALGCEIAVADLNDAASLAAALEGAQAVQMLCPVVADHPEPLQAMRHMTDVLAGALATARCPRVLAISDYGAQLSGGTGITLAFHYLEQRLKQLPVTLTLLRSAEHMQNWARVAKAALATGVLPSFHDPVTKQFPTVAAQDVGRIAAHLLMETPGTGSATHIVHVEGPRRLGTQDVAYALAEIGGRAVVAKVPPRDQWDPILVRAGLGPAYVQLVTELYDAHNAGLIDVEEGVGETRFGTTTLAEMLRSMLEA
jgi:NAD(P)H dehydrogenase (quinone)